jgi:soluble lytic murein transglycosylase
MKKILTVGVLAILCIWVLMKIPMAMYPLDYREYVVQYSEEFSLEPAFVFSVIRAESRFNRNAKSYKGAIGLMQIMFETAKNGADALGIENFTEEKLFLPEVNIRIGCWYLNKLRDEHQTMEAVLASYNAGGNKVRTWFEGIDYKQINQEDFIQKIPYPETRFFVWGVINNYKMYQRIYPLGG